MYRRAALLLLISLFLSGCASARNPADPLEPFNRSVYQLNTTLDKAVIKPVAQGYNNYVPQIVRTMVTNFFSNLDDVVVTTNDVLQLKLAQGCSDGMRFLVNSTVGVLGLIDVASMGPLKKHHEDFGQTLGKWGIGNGPYLVLPVLGPSTVRDGVGRLVDLYPDPTQQISDMRVRNQVYVAEGISHRAELLQQEKVLSEAMLDPYEFIRDAYLSRRLNQVYDDNPPRIKYDDESEEEPAAASPENSPPLPQ
jgi:phospholipid-binding lipoprotein MlaA